MTEILLANLSDVQDLQSGKQPLNANLTDISGLTPTDNNFIVGNGSNFVAESGATARGSLGFTDPILDKAAPGAIGGTTPGVITASNLAYTGTLTGNSHQPINDKLSAIAGLTAVADRLAYFTGENSAELAVFTSVARTLLAQSSQANMRTTGLGISSVGSTLITQTTQANMRTTGLGISSVGSTLITQTTQANMRTTGLGFSADTYLGGAWITPAFNAGNFTGSGSMTWTVESGDVARYKYFMNGKTMGVSFRIITSTVGGTLDIALQIALPAGKVANGRHDGWVRYRDDGATNVYGLLAITDGSSLIQAFKIDTSNWSSSTNQTEINGMIILETT